MLLFRDLPRPFGPDHEPPARTASLSACLCFSLLAFLVSFPPSLPHSLTKHHLSPSLNRKSVFLQCGSKPEIMEMVEKFSCGWRWSQQRGELIPCSPPLQTLFYPGMHSAWGQETQQSWDHKSFEILVDSCCLLSPRKQQLRTLSGHPGRMGEHQAK